MHGPPSHTAPSHTSVGCRPPHHCREGRSSCPITQPLPICSLKTHQQRDLEWASLGHKLWLHTPELPSSNHCIFSEHPRSARHCARCPGHGVCQTLPLLQDSDGAEGGDGHEDDTAKSVQVSGVIQHKAPRAGEDEAFVGAKLVLGLGR